MGTMLAMLRIETGATRCGDAAAQSLVGKSARHQHAGVRVDQKA
jgi:hypothetical protein